MLIPTLQYVLPNLSVDKYNEFAFDKLITIKFNSKIKIILNDQKNIFKSIYFKFFKCS